MEYEIGPDEKVSVAIVRAVGTVASQTPDTLPSLATVVDPEAVDRIFAPRGDGAGRTGGTLSFVYCDCRVTVHHSEYLTVEHLDTRDPSNTGKPGRCSD